MRSSEDFDDEIRAHIELETDRLIADGIPAAEAAARAKQAFGNVTSVREQFHESQRWIWLSQLRRDILFALRSMRKQPISAIAVVGTFALGIGATSAIVSVIDTVLLRPAPYPNGERLIAVAETRSVGAPGTTVASIKLEEWNRASKTIQGAAGYYTEPQSDTTGALPEKVTWALVTPGFFRVLGVRPEWGRDFTSDEEQPKGPSAVIISHALWVRHFGAAIAPAGKTIRLGRAAYSVVGVLSPTYIPPEAGVDVWCPVQFDGALRANREARFFSSFARLKPGVSRQGAEIELRGVFQQNADTRFDKGWTVTTGPLLEAKVAGVRRTLWVLGGAVGLLLLIACANVASLLIARGRSRQHEIAMRVSLGASRAQVVRQLLTESATLAVAGALAGLVLAWAGIRYFQGVAVSLPRVEEIRLDLRILCFTAGLAILTGILSGLFPALPLARRGERLLAEGGRGQIDGGSARTQSLIATAQMALTLVLLVGAGLMIRTLNNIRRADAGFTATGVWSLRVSASWGETNDMPRVARRLQTTLDALESVPGVDAAALSTLLPGAQTIAPSRYRLTGRSEAVTAISYAVSRRYFDTLRIPVLEGSTCAEGKSTALVNSSFARRYLAPGASAVGQTLAGEFGQNPEISGVVADIRDQNVARDPEPVVYTCGVPGYFPDPHYLVRSETVTPLMLRARLRELMPVRSVFNVQRLGDHIEGTSQERRVQTLLLIAFAGTALLLAAIGVFGLVSQFVSARYREFGLRVALGATRRDILWRTIRQAAWVLGGGAVAGLVLSMGLTRLLAASLYGVGVTDGLAFGASLLLLSGVTLLAAVLPARRAAAVDPMVALRSD